MPNFYVDHVEPWGGTQLTIWLKDEEGRTVDPKGLNYVVTVAAADVPDFMKDVLDAYVLSMQNLAVDLAAGGCRQCRNKRKVRGPNDTGLFSRPTVPCPVCIPRADKRLRQRIFRRSAVRAG